MGGGREPVMIRLRCPTLSCSLIVWRVTTFSIICKPILTYYFQYWLNHDPNTTFGDFWKSYIPTIVQSLLVFLQITSLHLKSIIYIFCKHFRILASGPAWPGKYFGWSCISVMIWEQNTPQLQDRTRKITIHCQQDKIVANYKNTGWLHNWYDEDWSNRPARPANIARLPRKTQHWQGWS